MGWVAAGMLSGLSGCGSTYMPISEVRQMAQPFMLRSHDEVLLEQRKCTNTRVLLADCDSRLNTTFRLREDVRENVYENLSDKLFGNSSSGNSHSHWRLKKDRVEWQYKF